MSNIVFIEVILFLIIYFDVVKCISVFFIIIFVIFCVIGVGVFVIFLKMGDFLFIMSMVFMVGGIILFLWVVFCFFWWGKEWVYVFIGSVVKEGICFFDVCDL